MEKLIAVTKLMAQTGLFFANTDGNYSQAEEAYINNYIASIEAVGELDDDLRNDIMQSLDKQISKEEIFEETENLLEGFSDDERSAILYAIDDFIQGVIFSDGNEHPQEEKIYEEWKQNFGIA